MKHVSKYCEMPRLTWHLTSFCIPTTHFYSSNSTTATAQRCSSSSSISINIGSSCCSIPTTKHQTCKQLAILSPTEVMVSWTSHRVFMHAFSFLHLMQLSMLLYVVLACAFGSDLHIVNSSHMGICLTTLLATLVFSCIHLCVNASPHRMQQHINNVASCIVSPIC